MKMIKKPQNNGRTPSPTPLQCPFHSQKEPQGGKPLVYRLWPVPERPKEPQGRFPGWAEPDALEVCVWAGAAISLSFSLPSSVLPSYPLPLFFSLSEISA